MRSSNLSILWGAIIFAILTSFVAYLFVESGSPFKVCIPTEGPATEQHQKAIAALDGVADIGIKLSTTLVGIGAAVLLGFKSGLKLTIPIRIIILFAAACFLQSTLYAVLWRLRV